MRKHYLDNIRWITAILVVFYHVIYLFNGVTSYPVLPPFSPVQPQDIFQYLVYPWFMLLLFTVSGMSARFYLEHHTHREFIRTKTQKLLIPSTLGLLVGGWVLGYYNIRIGGGWQSVSALPAPLVYLILCMSGCGVLWYIQVLWVFCIALVAFRKLERDRLYPRCDRATVSFLLALTAVIYGAAQILNPPVIVVYRFGIYGAGFFIGYLILSHDAVMERVEKQWLLLTALGLVSCIVFVVLFWGKSYSDHEVLDTLPCNIFGWTGTLGVLSFMKRWGDFQNGFTRWMGKHAWGLYVFHYLPIAMSGYYLRPLAPSLPPLLIYLLVGSAGFLGGFLLDTIIRRIPILRWCLLGIQKQQKEG